MAQAPKRLSEFDTDFDIWSLQTPELQNQRRREQRLYENNLDSHMKQEQERVKKVVNPTAIRKLDDDDSPQAKVVTFMSSQLSIICNHVLVHPFITIRRQCQVIS